MAEAGVEILCVGTELLLGDILNGNARWIAQRLAALGLPHYRQTVVGDNSERLAMAAGSTSVFWFGGGAIFLSAREASFLAFSASGGASAI